MISAPFITGFHRGVGLDVFDKTHLHARFFQIADRLIHKAESLHAAAAEYKNRLFAF